MDKQEITFLSAAELARAIRGKKLSPVEAVDAYLERIERLNGSLHAYITVTGELARAQAKKAERRLMAGDAKGALFGVPVGVKDQFWTKGILTTAASSAYKDFVPSDDATVVTRLRESGAVLLGKLNLGALALLEEDVPLWGECRNAWDQRRHCGGSSTGSGLALSTHLCAASVGEDTGGSGRIPASWSGVTGLRPTYGRVSRYGMMTSCWYLDTAAPMGKTAEDAALVLQAVAGYDAKDPYTSKRPVPDYTALLGKPIQGLRIGLVRELASEKVHPETLRLFHEAVDVLRSLGASVREVSVPSAAVCGYILRILNGAEPATAHAEILRTRPMLIRRPVRTWFWARGLLPVQHLHEALKARAAVRRQFLETFRSFDLLVSPTTNTPAALYDDFMTLGKVVSEQKEFATSEWVNPTAVYSVAALPAISVPCGFTTDQPPLPVGMQLGGPPFAEERLFQVAYAYQQVTAWHKRKAPAALA